MGGAPPMPPAGLLLPHNLRGDVRGPVEAVADGSELDAGDLIEQKLRDPPYAAVADGDGPAALEEEFADADDGRGGAAREGLGDDVRADLVDHLIDVDVALADGDAEVGAEGQETVARHAGEDCAGQRWRDQLAVADEEDVHAAEPFDAVA